ncbi:amidase family protein [Paenirhodobacter sp. CAU 1674]|uniref:amidase family protein n=1 Tax=Paenirhodobacter sp. CAU 1674 TaxID=3032596 RepID=UPI0023DC728F|nr:amidase family protein [Paenirhodobacter sp. CAU 1674]MDF2141788.1 amidase family protein [Paenirhodobacter sp. CAU 1674]
MTPTPLWSLSATQIAALVRARSLSAREVAQAALARLDAVNPAINAVVECRPEETLAAADRVDAMLAAGRDPGPLAGVPVTIKVNVDQTGYATTNGITLQKDLIAATNNPVVESLLSAGAVSLGRTNTPAFSYRWFTNNLLHGHTYNPRNRALTPGGSSGGAAAAVAAGIGAIGHGTDIAGSVRYPAYACGIHGLRPSIGRVAAWNASGKDRSIGGQIMAVSGPLARTVDDLRLALAAMARPDARDIWWVPAPLTGPAVDRRAALCLCPDGAETAPELQRALRAAAERLRDAGWQVDEVDDLPPIKQAVAVQLTLWMGDDYAGQVAMAEREGDPGAIAALAGQREFALSLGMAEFSAALTRRVTIARAWQLFTERYPVVLLPPSAELPFADDLDLRSDADYARVWEAQAAMIGLPVTGLPALTLATGATADGTPLGVQIVAGKYREDVALAAAEAIEARQPAVTIATPAG